MENVAHGDGVTWPQARRWLVRLMAIPVAAIAAYVTQSAFLHRSLGKLEARGGSIDGETPALISEFMGDDGCYAHWTRPKPSWAAWRLHDDYVLRHRCTVMFWRDPGDQGLALARDLSCTESIDAPEASITDEGLRSLRGFKRLRQLNLFGSHVTGPGLENTSVSDAGLESLKRLTKLVQLDLCGTRVTEAAERALGHIGRACPPQPSSLPDKH